MVTFPNGDSERARAAMNASCSVQQLRAAVGSTKTGPGMTSD